MDEEDEISNAFRLEQQHDHRLLDELDPFTLSQCDTFHELGEFAGSGLHHLPGVPAIVHDPSVPLFAEEAPAAPETAAVMEEAAGKENEAEGNAEIGKEVGAGGVVEMETESEGFEAVEAGRVETGAAAGEEAAKAEAGVEAEAEAEVVAIAVEEEAKLEMEVDAAKEEVEVGVDVGAAKEEADLDVDAAKEAVEVGADVGAAKEEVGLDVDVAMEEVEVGADVGAVKEEADLDVDATKEALETEAAREVSEVEVAADAQRPKKGGGKRKRGRAAVRAQKALARAPPKKKEEEDVCFICFDGGNLVLCDRRGCPKAYHPSCVNRDEAFFRARGRWTCGWHICSQCQKSAQYMCYTCTFSSCKGCIKEAGFLCVRGNKGLCSTCMRTVMLIERNVSANKGVAEVDFDDKSNWEYLFKDYWLDLRGKLSITSEEIANAKNPWKGFGVSAHNEESSGELYDANNDNGSSSDVSLGNIETPNSSKKKKGKKGSKPSTNEDSSSSGKKTVNNDRVVASGDSEWASNELLDLVAHMKGGDKSALTQFDVQELLLEYIKRNNLRDPRRKSQIICDSRLQNLFGKPRVGHFEMLKLLESHYFIKDAPDDAQGGVLDSEAVYVETESYIDAAKPGSDKRRKTRKRVEDREQPSNLDDYAAIDIHNISLVYLKRNLMEDLVDDIDKFQDTVVGSFVRIRISGAGQKQDMYRLVQVVGTGRAAEAYRTGKKTTDITLEILNLNKTEVITIDTISNQEFTEEECKRLRQSIKCGFISRLTVGEIYEKARALQAVRVKDWLDSEVLRLSHLRDRASEHGRKKDLRECVEKLELLNAPEERARRLQELPEVHADPNMDPSYVSDDDGDQDDRKQDDYWKKRDGGYTRKGREHIYSVKGGSVSNGGWNGACKASLSRWDSSRNMPTKGAGWDKGDVTVERITESLNHGKDVNGLNSRDPLRGQGTMTNSETGAWNSQSTTSCGSSPNVAPEISSVQSTGISSLSSVNETDKIWHYQDPSGKIQGPFNMTQIRKWSKTGYFPADLRIWKTSEKQEDSILLTDALVGKVEKDKLQLESDHNTFSHHGANNLTRTDAQQADGNLKPNWQDAGASANVSVTDWGSCTPSLVASEAELVTPKEAYSEVRDLSKDSNAWSSQSQNHVTRPTQSVSGQSQHIPYARDGESGRRVSRWDSDHSYSSALNVNRTSGFQSTAAGQSCEGSVLPPAIITEGWESEQGSKNDSNLPTLTPKPSNGAWAAVQSPMNMWSASPAAPVLASSAGWDTTTNAAAPGHSNTASLCEVKANEIAVSQQKASELEQLSSSSAFEGNMISLTSSGLAVTTSMRLDSIVIEGAFQANSQGPDAPSPGSVMRLVDLPGHNPEILLQATNDASVKGPGLPISESMPSKPIMSQPNTNIGNWAVASTTHVGPLGWDMGSTTAGGNVQSNQTAVNVWKPGPPIEPSMPVNTGWGTIPADPNAGWGMTPEGANQGWVPAQGNANLGWGIPPTGNTGTGWGAVAQGNPSTGWAMAVPGNTNMGWAATPQGNVNANLDSSIGNPNIWASQQKHTGERFPGQGDRGFHASDSGHVGGRPWNRQHGGGGPPSRAPPRGGSGICKYHENGFCKKGASCNYLHT